MPDPKSTFMLHAQSTTVPPKKCLEPLKSHEPLNGVISPRLSTDTMRAYGAT